MLQSSMRVRLFCRLFVVAAITAAGMGCQAAMDAERWLEDQG